MKILHYPALLLLALAGACGAYGQIEMQSFFRGGYFKVIDIVQTKYYVDYEGKRHEGDNKRLRFKMADSYADGYVKVGYLDSGYEEEKQKGRVLVKKPFFLRAAVTADRSLKNCFAVLLFSSNGSMSTFYQSIGSLKAGSEKNIKIRMPAHIDRLGSLHIFTKGDEVKTNQTTAGMSLQAEFKELTKDFQGVALAEIYNDERSYPHRLTSDGKYLATYRDQGTHHDLVIINTGDLSIYDRQEIGRHDEQIETPYWVDNDSLLFVHDGKLKSYSLKDKLVKTVRKGINRIVSNVKDGERIIIFSNYSNRFYNFNYKKGKDESYYQLPSNTLEVFFDSNGNVRIKKDYNNGTFSHYYKENTRARWREIDDINKSDEISFNYRYKTLLDQDVFISAFSNIPDVLFVYSNNSSDTRGLYSYDLKTGKLVDLIYRDEEYDIGGDGVNGTDLYFNSKRELIGLSYWRDRHSTEWFDPKFAQVQKMVDQAMPNTMNKPVDWTDDAKTMIYYSFSEKDQGSYYMLQLETGKFRKILEVQPNLKKFNLASTTPVEFQSKDGTQIHGYLTLPPNEKENLPLIVHPHGGPDERNYLEFSPINQFFGTRGFAILEVAYRGSAGYGVKHKLDGLVGNLDTLPIDDLAAGALYLVDRGIANPEKISILGNNWGGYLTYMSLIRYPNLFKCGVAAAAPTNMALMLLSDNYPEKAGGRAFWNRILKGDGLEENYIKRISPLFMADKINGPVMIIHEEYDYVITLDQAKFMAKALEKAGKEHEFIIVRRRDRGYSKSPLNHYLNTAETFLKKHLEIGDLN